MNTKKYSDEPRFRLRGLVVICGIILITVFAVWYYNAEDSSQQSAAISVDAPVGVYDTESSDYLYVDLLGNRVQGEGIGDTEGTRQMSNTGSRVVIPSLSADFALGSLEEHGVINPTNYTSVFWIKNRGVDVPHASEGTVYLATHALDFTTNGLSPGNVLYSSTMKRPQLNKGDTMIVDGVAFRFTEFRSVSKKAIPQDRDIWDARKENRLVLLTCIANSDYNGVFIFEAEDTGVPTV